MVTNQGHADATGEDALFAKGETFLSTIPLQERVALGSRVWLVWSRRAARYRMELTPRHIEILRRFHNGETTDVIASALNVGVRSIQSDQDRIKAMLYAAYGKDLRREAACPLFGNSSTVRGHGSKHLGVSEGSQSITDH